MSKQKTRLKNSVWLVIANLIVVAGLFCACVPALVLDAVSLDNPWYAVVLVAVCFAASWFLLALGNTGIQVEMQELEERDG